MTPVQISLTLLARAQDTGPDPSEVRPGWIALGLMVLLGVATFLLWMNMRKQIRKIDFVEEPDAEQSPDDTDAGQAGPDGSTTGTADGSTDQASSANGEKP